MIKKTTWLKNTCPVNQTLDFFNRKWVFSILTDLFVGKKHFSEFLEENKGLNNFTLSQTLKFMEENDLIRKVTYENQSRSTEYHLTERGKKVNKILYEMVEFSLGELGNSQLSDKGREEMKKRYIKAFNIDE